MKLLNKNSLTYNNKNKNKIQLDKLFINNLKL